MTEHHEHEPHDEGDGGTPTVPARHTATDAARKGSSSSSSSSDAGASIGKLLTLGLIVGVGFVVVKQLPELQRYLKMRQM